MVRSCLLVIALGLLPLGPFVFGQTPSIGPALDILVPYVVGTPLVTNSGTLPLIEERAIYIPGASSLRVIFASTTLGPSDSILVIAPSDGESHRLDPTELDKWAQTSAYFNGDLLTLRLVVSPGSTASFSVTEVIMGIPAGGAETLCGPDDRVPSTDNRSMRLVSSPTSTSGGCTIWLASQNDIALTAGHCSVGANSVAEANVPPSLPNGAAQHPPVQFQFPVISITATNGGQGNDYRICRLMQNNLSESPSSLFGWFTLGLFIPIVNDTIRITGYGTDNGVENVTPQTSTGPYTSTSGTSLRYRVDTMGGNSGSPVILETTGEAVGIHTHGGCTASGGANSGTSLTNSGFQNAWLTSVGPFPTSFNLDLSTSGSGAGDLHLAVNNMPSAAVQGFTLFSFDTSGPVGQGTLFGIRADPFTLQGVLSPPTPTNLFHFVTPFVTGVYPDGAFDLPLAALPFPLGTMVDGQVVVFEPNFTNAVRTNVVRITF